MIFADDEDQSWQVSASGAAMARKEKDVTPATSPDTSREEVEASLPSASGSRRSFCASANKLQSCWSYMLLCTAVAITTLGWYNCHTGIILQTYLADMEEYQAVLVAMFWGLAVGIVVLLSVVMCLAKLSNTDSKS